MRIMSFAPCHRLSPSLVHRLHHVASVRYGIRCLNGNRAPENTTLTGSRSTEAVVGVAGGLENVEEREEKSRTGEDIATNMLERSRRNRGQGWKVVKTRKLRPKGRRASSFCHHGTRRPN